jgi:hypothetical protein
LSGGEIAAMRPYDPNLPLFSMHIPKCGGTSLLRALRRWFWPWRVIAHYQRDALGPPSPIKVGAKMCVHGHLNSARARGVMDFYPQAQQFITFLREPFDRAVSLWHFMPKVAKERGDLSWVENPPEFASWLRKRAALQKRGLNFESVIWHFPKLPNEVPIAEQMDRSFVFVGIMERYQESLDALACALGKRRMKVAHLNRTERTNEYEELRKFYRQHFTEEYEVYETALKRNDELLRQYL